MGSNDHDSKLRPCKTCGKSGPWKDCADCFEVESRLAGYLARGGVNARYFVIKTLAQAAGPPSKAEAEEQRLDWTYGNLAASTNHKPVRDAFLKLAVEQLGWTAERFDKWAKGREWRKE